MKIFGKLKAIKTVLREIPGIKTFKELDILIEIGYHQEEGSPLTLKQLMLLGIASQATVRRHLNYLMKKGMVKKAVTTNDNRSVTLYLSESAIGSLTRHYFKLTEQLVEPKKSPTDKKQLKVSEKQIAMASCACPRPAGQTMATPICNVEYYSGGHSNHRNGVLFVISPPNLKCKYLERIGHGHCCTDKMRLHVYHAYGI